MATDFSYGNSLIGASGPFKPTGKDIPIDARTRVETFSEITAITNPYVGMLITVLNDETNSGKMTDYKVKSLKANSLGAPNSAIDEVVRYVDYLGVSSSGGGTSAGTGEGLTTEQAQQLQTAYEHSQSVHVQASDIPSKTSDLTNDSNYATETFVTSKIAEAQLGGGEADLSAYATKAYADNAVSTALDGHTFKFLTQAEYDILETKDPLVEYHITDATEPETIDTTSFATDLSLTGSKLQLKNSTGALIGKPITLPTSSGSSSEWSGKVANFLGDSQTEKNQHKTKIYHDWVKEILGLSKVNNYGISGATIAKKSSNDRIAMCLRYTNMDDNADLICVMGGVNDRWFNCQMGSFGDTNETTFYGAMEILCDGLLNKYPGKTIIFITPTEQNHSDCNSSNRTGYTPTDFANAMKRVCAKYSIPVFDANTCSGIYPLNEANASLYTTDKLHLNNKGNEVLGKKLSKFILNGANVVVINNGDSGEGGGGSTSNTYGNIVISKTTATINEGGTDTFTVKLDKAPTNSQVVNISSNNTDVTLSARTLTFNSSNYSTPQTVTINVAEDSDAVNDNCKLTISSNNVLSKTITITITDNDTSPETPPETPGENQFIGKTVRVTKNFASNYAHLVALLNVDEDMRSNSTYNIVLNGSNISNMSSASTGGGCLYSDNIGEVSNSSFVGEASKATTFTQTVSDGNLTITAGERTTGAVSTDYIKVPIIVSGTVPYSFQINEIKVIVNGTERNILKLGSFFASDKEAITIE